MQITLQKTAEGIRVISGHMRLKAALSLKDEVKVESLDIGEILIVRLPDGCLVATQDQRTMALLGL